MSFWQNLARLRTPEYARSQELAKKRQNLIKILPFWERYNLIKFSPFYRGRGPQKIHLYFWGEGANEQKTNKRIKRVCLVKRKICDAYAPSQELAKKRHGVSTRYCVLVGLNGIKILPFWGRYNLIKFSPFWGEFFMSLRSTALRCCGNLPEGNHITKPTQDTVVLARNKKRTVSTVRF